jgi:hypothetical protein
VTRKPKPLRYLRSEENEMMTRRSILFLTVTLSFKPLCFPAAAAIDDPGCGFAAQYSEPCGYDLVESEEGAISGPGNCDPSSCYNPCEDTLCSDPQICAFKGS